MGTIKRAILDASSAMVRVWLALLVRRQRHVATWSQMAPLTCLMSVDDAALVLPLRRGVLPLLNLAEVGE